MNVGIDISALGEKGLTGVGVTLDNLVKNLAKVDKINQYHLCFRLSRLKYGMIKPPVRQDNFYFKIIQEPFNFIFERKLDVFHGIERLPNYKKPKKVVTIHDISVVKGEGFWTDQFREMVLSRYKKYTNGGADAIITPSEYTKSDICDYYGVDTSRVTAIHHGITDDFQILQDTQVDSRLKKLGINSPYILNVSAIQERKNMVRLIEAFDLFLKTAENPETKLVLCGKPTYGAKRVFETIEKLNLSKKVVVLGYIETESLVALYNGAMMLCFPSLYEGFGVPIIEAFACGCPVVTSNCTSMPEIAGDAGIIVEPTSVEDIAYAMKEMAKPERKEHFSQLALERSKLFSYETTAKKHIEVYKSLL